MGGLQKLYFGIAGMTASRSLDGLMRVVWDRIRPRWKPSNLARGTASADHFPRACM